MQNCVRLIALTMFLAGAMLASKSSAAEIGRANTLAVPAGSESIVVAWAIMPPSLAAESDVIQVQGKKKKKTSGAAPQTGAGKNGASAGNQGNRGGGNRGGGNRGRNTAIGVGVGAALLGGLIANQAAQSSRSSSASRSCTRWAYQCDEEEISWACRRFRQNCR